MSYLKWRYYDTVDAKQVYETRHHTADAPLVSIVAGHAIDLASRTVDRSNHITFDFTLTGSSWATLLEANTGILNLKIYSENDDNPLYESELTKYDSGTESLISRATCVDSSSNTYIEVRWQANSPIEVRKNFPTNSGIYRVVFD